LGSRLEELPRHQEFGRESVRLRFRTSGFIVRDELIAGAETEVRLALVQLEMPEFVCDREPPLRRH
jgi:hypothetical protein